MRSQTVVAVGTAGLIVLGGPVVASVGSPASVSAPTITASATPNWNDLDAWSKRTRYDVGDLVKYGTRAYEAQRSGKRHKPSSHSSWWSIIYAFGQPGTGPAGATGPAGPTGLSGPTGVTGPTGPSNGYLATDAAPIALSATLEPLVTLTLGPGNYMLSATTNTISAGNGVIQCNFTNVLGDAVTAAPLWTRTVFVGANTYSNVAITYALTLPVLAASTNEPVSLACRTTAAAAITSGTSTITAIRVGSLN